MIRTGLAMVSALLASLTFPRQPAQEPAQKELELVLSADPKVRMKFVWIEPGTFTMGNPQQKEEAEPHEVKLTKGYWLQTTETTNDQWKAVMGEVPSDLKRGDLPVHCVSWEKGQKFLQVLNEKLKDQLKGLKARLPTEAQWEYACRAGSKARFHFGDDEKPLPEYAWFGDGDHHYESEGHGMHPVAQKKPNAWGLYDMYGNVFEWCHEDFGRYPKKAVVDPVECSEPESLDYLKSMRGGCWLSEAKYLGSGHRTMTAKGNPWGPDRDPIYGLRVCVQ